MKERICAVVVTYNRKELLMECLSALKNQTYPLEGIYIIDNASTDGTPNLLLENKYIKELPPQQLNAPWEEEYLISREDKIDIKVHYVRMNENTGGSGGFYEGMKRAYENGYDWIWVMDDDTLPQTDNMERIIKYFDRNTSAFCSLIKKKNNEIDFSHREHIRIDPFVRFLKIKEDMFLSNEVIDIDKCSFVSMIINSKAIEKIGLPNKDFFIDFDDIEYSLRLLKYGKIKCVNSAITYHGKLDVNLITNIIPWRLYYSVRNRIIVNKVYGKKPFSFFYPDLLTIKNELFYILRKRQKDIYLVYKEAIKDAKKSKLGKNINYLPGGYIK